MSIGRPASRNANAEARPIGAGFPAGSTKRLALRSHDAGPRGLRPLRGGTASPQIGFVSGLADAANALSYRLLRSESGFADWDEADLYDWLRDQYFAYLKRGAKIDLDNALRRLLGDEDE